MIEHELEYRYARAVRGSVMTLFVSPLVDRRQRLHEFSLETEPAGPVSGFLDPWGNRGHFFDRHAPHDRLRIFARSRVEVEPGGGGDTADEAGSGIDVGLMLQPSRFVRPSSAVLEGFISASRIPRAHATLESLRNLRSRIYRLFEYAPGSTAAHSPIDRILQTGRGVCQDYAHVMASICRRWGIPARYVSGYLAPAPGATTRGESHAWVECWLPGLGWTGFDPANDSACGERHLRVAVGRDYGDVPPSRGVFSGAAESVLITQVTIASRGTDRIADGDRGLHDSTLSRSTTPCKTQSDPSSPPSSSGSPRFSRPRPPPNPRAANRLRSGPTLSAATCGAGPTSENPWPFSPR